MKSTSRHIWKADILVTSSGTLGGLANLEVNDVFVLLRNKIILGLDVDNVTKNVNFKLSVMGK